MNTKFSIQKVLMGDIGFLMSITMIAIMGSKYKNSIIGDLSSLVFVISLLASIILIWKAFENIRPAILRIVLLGIQFSTLIIISYSIINYYLSNVI